MNTPEDKPVARQVSLDEPVVSLKVGPCTPAAQDFWETGIGRLLVLGFLVPASLHQPREGVSTSSGEDNTQ